MKLLTESLPQNDLQKICLLMARSLPAAAVKLLVFSDMAMASASSDKASSNDIEPKVQLITAVKGPVNDPETDPAFIPEPSSLKDIWLTGKAQVVQYPSNSGDQVVLSQQITVQPLQLTLPEGLFVEDSYEGCALKSPDSHYLPALKTVLFPAVLCLLGLHNEEDPKGQHPDSVLSRLRAFSELLEQSVNSWTLIRHEQQLLRKLKHDLRTPLTSLTMLPDMIKSAPGIDPESAQMCEQLKTAAHKLDLILLAAQGH